MSHVVYLCGMKVHPANTGGFLHVNGISRALLRLGHRVSIYSLSARAEDYRLAGPRSRVDTIEPGLTEEVHLGLGIGVLQTVNRRLGYPRVWQYEMLRRGRGPRRMKQALAAADIVLADSAYVPRVPGPWHGKPWYLISHNVEHRLLEQGNAQDRRCVEWMRRIEAAAPQQFDDIVACTSEDQAFFREHDSSAGLRLPIVGSGVDGELYVAPPGLRQRMRAQLGLDEADTLLLFSGSRAWQNIEALERVKAFAAREREFLRSRRIHILLMGAMEAQPYREGALIATGPVPEAPPYFAAADAGFNPVTKGSGANVKLYEYLAARLPVIATPFGVRGTGLQPERDYLAFDDDTLAPVLERFLRERSRAQWRAHAEALWQREEPVCDMHAMVRAAVAQLPAFGGA